MIWCLRPFCLWSCIIDANEQITLSKDLNSIVFCPLEPLVCSFTSSDHSVFLKLYSWWFFFVSPTVYVFCLSQALSSPGLYLGRNHWHACCNQGWPTPPVNSIDYFDFVSVSFPSLFVHVFVSSADSCSCVRGQWLFQLAEASSPSSPITLYQLNLYLFQNSTWQVTSECWTTHVFNLAYALAKVI